MYISNASGIDLCNQSEKFVYRAIAENVIRRIECRERRVFDFRDISAIRQ